MATAKIYTSDPGDIINGLSVVNNGVKTTSYDDPARSHHLAQPSGTILNNINARYKLHGGAGGSGNWEH